MRKNVAIITVMVMLFTLVSGFFVTSNAENSLKEGDYVKLGTYHGAEILWRVVDLDEDGDPMLLSDKILTVKPYALYNHDIGFTERHWETSYIRTWLNSKSGSGQTKYVVEDNALSNPMNGHIWNYDEFMNEAGFLSSKNFTLAEFEILKESKQRDTLVGKYIAEKEGGDQILKDQDTDIAGYAALVQKLYYKYVTDKIFVMDAVQFNDVYKKFGSYVLTGATNECLQYEKNAKSELIDTYFSYSNAKITLEKPFDYTMYYLRNIYDRNTSDIFRYLIMSVEFQNVGEIKPFSGYTTPDGSGVRPACFIDMSKTDIASGSGTKDDPYRFDVKNIYGNADTEKPQPVRVVGMWSNFIKFTEASGIPFVDSANRTQVPLRMTMENLFAKVTWDSASKTAIVEKNGIKVEVPVGKNYIVVNGVQQTIDTSAQIVNGKTYLPIKSVVVALGGEVSWDSATKTVIIKGFN